MKLFNSKKKTAIICIHGFGVRGPAEFANLEPVLKDAGYDVFIPKLFDFNNPQDIYWENWVHRAENIINQSQNNYENIILIGFSMGGIIASYLANKPKVKKIILLAPAYDYINIDNVIDYIFKKSTPSLINKTFKDTFRELVDNCKITVEDINVPVLVIHCANDEVISISSSIKLMKKIKTESKILLTISNGQHRLLDDTVCKELVIDNITSFIKIE